MKGLGLKQCHGPSGHATIKDDMGEGRDTFKKVGEGKGVVMEEDS